MGATTRSGGKSFPGFSAIAEHILPLADDTYDLGSLSLRWSTIYAVIAVLTSVVIGGLVKLAVINGVLFINASTVINGSLNVTDQFHANQYLTDQGNFAFNFYDDGSEFFWNMTEITDAFNIETDNTKLVLFNEPKSANDFKVFQVMSKEASDVTEFVVTKAGVTHASYFVRSLSLAGNGTQIPTPFNCSTYAKYIDCDADLTGPDFYVLDDIEINGSLFVDNGNLLINNISQGKNNFHCFGGCENSSIHYNGSALIIKVN